MCGGSPRRDGFIVLCFYLFEFFNMSGRFTGEEILKHSRSPLYEPVLQREDDDMCGGSPLSWFMCSFWLYRFVSPNSSRGDSQERRSKKYTLVLPSMNRNICIILPRFAPT